MPHEAIVPRPTGAAQEWHAHNSKLLQHKMPPVQGICSVISCSAIAHPRVFWLVLYYRGSSPSGVVLRELAIWAGRLEVRTTGGRKTKDTETNKLKWKPNTDDKQKWSALENWWRMMIIERVLLTEEKQQLNLRSAKGFSTLIKNKALPTQTTHLLDCVTIYPIHENNES